MPRYRLRTLLLLLAILPPLLAVGWWRYSAWQAEQARLKAKREAAAQTFHFYIGFDPGADTEPSPVPLDVDVPFLDPRPSKSR